MCAKTAHLCALHTVCNEMCFYIASSTRAQVQNMHCYAKNVTINVCMWPLCNLVACTLLWFLYMTLSYAHKYALACVWLSRTFVWNAHICIQQDWHIGVLCTHCGSTLLCKSIIRCTPCAMHICVPFLHTLCTVPKWDGLHWLAVLCPQCNA